MSANVYYNPENFGLTILHNIDHSDCYEFDTLLIFQHEDGTLYYAQDSGCSCPTPFEDFNSISDLTLVTNETFNSFKDTLKNHHGVDIAEFLEVSADIEKLLKKQQKLKTIVFDSVNTDNLSEEFLKNLN